MRRRTMLAGAGLAATAGIAGCLDRLPGTGPDAEFEAVDAELPADEPPDVTVDGDVVTARGTVVYGSSSCGVVELAHAEYEDSQNRLDLLVVAGDDSDRGRGCTDDVAEGGYRVEATVDGDLRRVAATEHHAFGETYSTTVDATDR